jgi:protein-L-isoaspartate O-methyltransferase
VQATTATNLQIERDRMVRTHLVDRGIRYGGVLDAMSSVPREQFAGAGPRDAVNVDELDRSGATTTSPFNATLSHYAITQNARRLDDAI